jgi:hypothetical protein
MPDAQTILLVIIGFIAGIFACRAWYRYRAKRFGLIVFVMGPF